MEYSVETNIQDEIKRLRDLPTKVINNAVVRTINDTLRSSKTQAVRAVQNELGLRNQKPIRSAISVINARREKRFGSLIASGKAIPLAHYKGVYATNTGVNANIMGKRITINSGFRSRKSMGNHYFRRLDDSSRPSGLMARKIYELTGPSVPRGMLQRTANRTISATIDATFAKRLAHHIKRFENQNDAKSNMVKIGKMGRVSF